MHVFTIKAIGNFFLQSSSKPNLTLTCLSGRNETTLWTCTTYKWTIEMTDMKFHECVFLCVLKNKMTLCP